MDRSAPYDALSRGLHSALSAGHASFKLILMFVACVFLPSTPFFPVCLEFALPIVGSDRAVNHSFPHIVQRCAGSGRSADPISMAVNVEMQLRVI